MIYKEYRKGKRAVLEIFCQLVKEKINCEESHRCYPSCPIRVAKSNPFEVKGEWQGKPTYAWFWDYVCARGVPQWCLGCPTFPWLFPDICASFCMKTGKRVRPPIPFNRELTVDDGVHVDRYFCCDEQKWATKQCFEKHMVIPITIEARKK